jgi:two-component system chemotaxis response regulator CheY
MSKIDKSKCRILLADDHVISIKLVTRQLENLGFSQIQSVSDGSLALKLLEKDPVDIVIIDWAMPVMDGLAVLKASRALPQLNHTAFIMLSAEMQDNMISKAMEAGATAYIVKPMTPDALKEKTEAALDWIEKSRKAA